ncbi:MAG: Haloacid dehalogenase [uncultured Sulfurovum sp.]|uniref:Haloacid dehalogenase n=1 Tax=uncultured Sulfurovum sp. TaxID=269237 RepID=A0A6S6TG59_9BACT|nr:MAG: Haloacid dehalogenase [uncultured Sulfurovum sp.]
MQKLFITDLDHTFLHSTQSVSQFSKDIWNEKANHAMLSIATARSFAKTNDFLKDLKLNIPLITLDGAMVANREKKLIDLNVLDKNIGDAIIEESKKFDIFPYVIALSDHKYLNETFEIPSQLNYHQERLIKDSYTLDKRLSYVKNIRGAKDTLKLVYMGEEKVLRPLAQHLSKVFTTSIEVKLAPENYMNCYFLTILHPLSDKAHALSKVHEYLNVEAKNTTVFGDGLNDIGMFKLAGTAVAVHNALDSVKDKANIILKETNDEDAVAKYLEKNIATLLED